MKKYLFLLIAIVTITISFTSCDDGRGYERPTPVYYQQQPAVYVQPRVVRPRPVYYRQPSYQRPTYVRPVYTAPRSSSSYRPSTNYNRPSYTKPSSSYSRTPSYKSNRSSSSSSFSSKPKYRRY